MDRVLWSVFRTRIRIGIGSGFIPVRGFKAGSGADSGAESRRAKITHKKRKKFRNFMFWSAGCFLYGGLGISTVNSNFWSQNIKFFSALIFGHQNHREGSVINAKICFLWISKGIFSWAWIRDPDLQHWREKPIVLVTWAL